MNNDKYNPQDVFANPTHDRSELRSYVRHKASADKKAYFIGENVESLEFTITSDTQSKNTIAKPTPIITNKVTGRSASLSVPVTPDSPAYNMFTTAGLTDMVNEEFELITIFGGMGVDKDGTGTVVSDAPFATVSNIKLTMTSFGGGGVETTMMNFDMQTDGEVKHGIMPIEKTGGTGLNYDPDIDAWESDAFVEITNWGFDAGESQIVIGGNA